MEILKYIIILILISFLISKLSNKDSVYEGYIQEKDYNEKLKELTSRYNTIIDPQKAGSINLCPGEDLIQTKKKYHPLKQRSIGDYKPYENILPKRFKYDRIKPEVKTDEIKIKVPKEDKKSPPKEKVIKEFSDKFEGREFIEENNCQGEWSPWNTETCGLLENRCGIKSKQYRIIKKEVSNEKGEGKPCEYKDGEIKYKYCIGSTLDVDSNQERCNLDINVCRCQLNNETVKIVDGENVYDLLDDCNYEKNLNCSCPPGSSIILDDKDTTKLGKCKLKSCSCDNGTEVLSDDCNIQISHSPDIDVDIESCKLNKCNDGYVLTNNPLKCIQHTGNECNCPYGEQESSDRCTNPLEYNINCKQGSCKNGFRWTNDVAECDNHFTNINNDLTQSFNSIQCCVPIQCDVSKIKEYNIVHKHVSGTNNISTYMKKTIKELIDEYNSLTISNKEGTDTLLNHNSPKENLIQLILENKDDTIENKCITSGNINDCSFNFECSPGYSFLPSDENDTELMLIDCNEDGIQFNGQCLPVSCDIPNNIKELYNLSFDKCNSNSDNCGERTLNCSNEDPEKNKKIFCKTPYKIKSIDKSQELIHYGCK